MVTNNTEGTDDLTSGLSCEVTEVRNSGDQSFPLASFFDHHPYERGDEPPSPRWSSGENSEEEDAGETEPYFSFQGTQDAKRSERSNEPDELEDMPSLYDSISEIAVLGTAERFDAFVSEHEGEEYKTAEVANTVIVSDQKTEPFPEHEEKSRDGSCSLQDDDMPALILSDSECGEDSYNSDSSEEEDDMPSLKETDDNDSCEEDDMPGLTTPEAVDSHPADGDMPPLTTSQSGSGLMDGGEGAHRDGRPDVAGEEEHAREVEVGGEASDSFSEEELFISCPVCCGNCSDHWELLVGNLLYLVERREGAFELRAGGGRWRLHRQASSGSLSRAGREDNSLWIRTPRVGGSVWQTTQLQSLEPCRAPVMPVVKDDAVRKILWDTVFLNSIFELLPGVDSTNCYLQSTVESLRGPYPPGYSGNR